MRSAVCTSPDRLPDRRNRAAGHRGDRAPPRGEPRAQGSQAIIQKLAQLDSAASGQSCRHRRTQDKCCICRPLPAGSSTAATDWDRTPDRAPVCSSLSPHFPAHPRSLRRQSGRRRPGPPQPDLSGRSHSPPDLHPNSGLNRPADRTTH